MTIKTKCLECDGEGYLEVVTGIDADGDQIIAKCRCEKCDGTGQVEMGEEEAEALLSAAEEVMSLRRIG